MADEYLAGGGAQVIGNVSVPSESMPRGRRCPVSRSAKKVDQRGLRPVTWMGIDTG